MEATAYSFVSGILSIEEMFHLRGGNDGPKDKSRDGGTEDDPDVTKD
ncbi:MAG: hypothetical protein IH594_02380 [Bacteroidales bacterium]|nr:hypothetical protein [Bacteroidales bacterium]